VLEDGTPHDRLGGFGSGIAYTGVGTKYVATPDRGPSGKTSYANRYYLFDIVIDKGGAGVDVRLIAAKTLSNESGQPFVGTERVFESGNTVSNRALDPEAIRSSGRGTFFLSDEYGPFISEFDADGKELRKLPVPAKFVSGSGPDKKGDDGQNTGTPESVRGRQPKCGMEGLAVSPDGGKVVAIMQSPLFQDNALDEHNESAGLHNRILEIDLATNQTREFVYQLDAKKNGVNEMVAIGDEQFLVLERDTEGSSTTAFAKIFKIDISRATDVSGIERLPARKLGPGVRPVDKRLFIDLRDRRFGPFGPACPAKAEGLTFGPDFRDGRHLLLVSCDNDFNASTATEIMAFAVMPHALPSFQRQTLIPTVEVTLQDEAHGRPTLRVALLGGPLFDAVAVDARSIGLDGASLSFRSDRAPDCTPQDVNGDGVTDLVCKMTLENKAELPRAVITAQTLTGNPIRASVTLRGVR
jgi:hypothetical protein